MENKTLSCSPKKKNFSEAKSLMEMIVDNAPDAVITLDAEGLVLSWNAQAENMFGWDAKQTIAWEAIAFVTPSRYKRLYELKLKRFLSMKYQFSGRFESVALHREGYEFPVELSVSLLRPAEGGVVISIFVRDITERKRINEQLEHRASHDDMTGLANKSLFLDFLRRKIEYKKSRKNYLFAVLFLDIDNFKSVNDKLGHIAGDRMLVSVARRLNKTVRPMDVVARFGGDEFAILLNDIVDWDDVTHIAERISEEMAVPFQICGQDIYSSASIGIVKCMKNYNKAEDILHEADMAMYHAKSKGKARCELIDFSDNVVSFFGLNKKIAHG